MSGGDLIGVRGGLDQRDAVAMLFLPTASRPNDVALSCRRGSSGQPDHHEGGVLRS
jgi:hypothetical protein